MLRITLALAAAACTAAQVVTETSLRFSWSQPPSAMPLPQDLCGFSIESDRFPHWAGNVTSKNVFTYNLMNNLKEKTGKAPHIRQVPPLAIILAFRFLLHSRLECLVPSTLVGGGSQEYIVSTPNVTSDPGFYNVFAAVPATPTNTKSLFPQAKFTGAGFKYWLVSGNFPAGTRFTWGVNFRAGNTSEAIAQVQQIEKAFADPHCRNVTLDSIELGNEADSWNDGDRRPKTYSVWNYKDEQVNYFANITKALGQSGRKYRVGDFALYWNSMDLFGTGIMDTVMGGSIKTISEHHYQGTTDLTTVAPSRYPAIATDLVYKDYIRNNISSYTLPALDAQKAGIQFVLGETSTYFGHGQPGVSNSAAAALWMIDYSLQAACNGISGLHFHQGVGYNYSAFVPVDNIGINITDFAPNAKRHVMPLYYGYLAVADAIGRSSNSYVNELWIEKNRVAAYQIWEGRVLKRIMVINGVPWTTASTGARPIYAINLPDLAGRTGVTFKTLEFSSLSALEGLKWGGQTWETYSGLPDGTETFEQLDSQGTVRMNASSATLIYL